MKHLATLTMVLMVGLTACKSTRLQPELKLTSGEIQQLSSKENCILSNSLRERLIADCNELKLTPEEMQVLKSTGKVILCGKCGYILNSRKFKTHEAKELNEMKQHTRTKSGFQNDSLRQRIIMTYTN